MRIKLSDINDEVQLILNVVLNEHFRIETFKENPNINYPLIIDILKYNSLLPLFIDNLTNEEWIWLNDKFHFIDFKKALKTHQLRDLLTEGVYQKTITILNQNNIKVIPLKGIFLKRSIYKKPYLRPMIDIDILVSEPEKAFSILCENQYKILNDATLSTLEPLKHQLKPLAYNGITIEIHRSLTDDFDTGNIPLDFIWQTSTPSPENPYCYNLSKEILLLHLLHHAYSTRRGGPVKLIWYIDIILFINKYGQYLNWADAIELAMKWNIYNSLTEGLIIINELSDNIHIPKKIKELIENSKTSDIEIFPVKKEIPSDYSHYYEKFVKVRGAKNKILLVTQLLFPPKSYLELKYEKRKLYIFLYVKHIVKSIRIAFGAFWGYVKK